MKHKIDFLSLMKELPFCLCIFSLGQVGGNGEPFGAALLLGLGAAGYSLPLSYAAFLFSALPHGNQLFWIYFGQSFLLAFSFFLRRKLFGQETRGKLLLPFSALIAGLLLYVFTADFLPYPIPFELSYLQDGFFQKALIAFLLLLLAAICVVAASALRYKFLKSKMKNDETVFCLLIFALCGCGFARFFGVNAYLGMAFYILLLFCAITQDAWGTVCAFVLALPPFLVCGTTIERFFLYGVLLVLFSKTGKTGESFAFLCAYLFFGFLDGLYDYESKYLVEGLLCALIPTLAFLLTPNALLIRAETALIFYRERHLSRLAINRNRSAIAERLFEISGLFKEIQSTFLTLGNTDGDAAAKAYLQGRVLNGVCKQCSGYGTCLAEGLLPSLNRMLEIGKIKGKVSLIDFPAQLCANCGRQSDLLYSINCHLGEYRAYMQDSEAAANGRQLLANQALGVSEIVKSLALEQSEPMSVYTKKERALENALLKVGIICSEILIYGGEEPTVSLVMQGNGNLKKLSAAVSNLFGSPFCVAEKLTLARDKYCCILRKKPTYDAAFGVAAKTKEGETFSGDTYSIIKIDERKFLVALSDGMGSGEKAKSVSENSISLIESFYRAKMPPELTLSTVNRLLSFSKEETFACVDIAVVDLDFGRADVVKIGSPIGFILSESTMQILENESLPLGILERIHPDTASYPFKADDLLVFLSDGVTDAFASSVELYEAAQALPRSNPQDFADRLLEAALARYNGSARDDMTVLAIRIFST